MLGIPAKRRRAVLPPRSKYKIMAYDKQKIFEQAKEVTVKNKLFFIEDIVAFLPCSKNYFYDHFPPDSNEYDELKALLAPSNCFLTSWYLETISATRSLSPL